MVNRLFALHRERDARALMHDIGLLGQQDDLVEIYEFVAAPDSPSKEDYLLNRLEKTCASLERFPARGRIPPELRRIGVTSYREILVGPYRIVYRVGSSSVHVYAVLDGRRDLSETLERRLIR